MSAKRSPMNSIVLNMQGSKITALSEAFCIRMAYLLSDSTQSVGEAVIAFEDWFNLKSYKRKAMVAIHHFSKEKEINDEMAHFVTQMEIVLNNYTAYTKLKHKDPAQIKSVKIAEHFIDTAFEAVKNDIKISIDQMGLGNLHPLLKTGHLNCIYIAQENEENEKQRIYKIKNIFVPDTNPEDYETDIFCLPMEFFLPEFDDIKKYDVSEAGAENEENVCLTRCFEMPNINPCGAVILEGIRADITNETMTSLRQKTDRLISVSKNAPSDAFEYLKNEVAPIFTSAGKIINSQKEIDHYGKHSGMVAWVCTGLIPMKTLLDVYVRLNVMKEEERIEIERHLAGNPSLCNRWPFISIHHKTELAALYYQPEAHQIVATKKSLNID